LNNLIKPEYESLIFQFRGFKVILKHSSINPLAFTEQGVSMLSSVLRSEQAIK
jgi:hypothetical protein